LGYLGIGLGPFCCVDESHVREIGMRWSRESRLQVDDAYSIAMNQYIMITSNVSLDLLGAIDISEVMTRLTTACQPRPISQMLAVHTLTGQCASSP
jgi:hypothetical protein